jgi:hypothetical protein
VVTPFPFFGLTQRRKTRSPKRTHRADQSSAPHCRPSLPYTLQGGDTSGPKQSARGPDVPQTAPGGRTISLSLCNPSLLNSLGGSDAPLQRMVVCEDQRCAIELSGFGLRAGNLRVADGASAAVPARTVIVSPARTRVRHVSPGWVVEVRSW